MTHFELSFTKVCVLLSKNCESFHLGMANIRRQAKTPLRGTPTPGLLRVIYREQSHYHITNVMRSNPQMRLKRFFVSFVIGNLWILQGFCITLVVQPRSGYLINIVLQSSYMSFMEKDNNVYGEILCDRFAASDALKLDSWSWWSYCSRKYSIIIYHLFYSYRDFLSLHRHYKLQWHIIYLVMMSNN